MLPSRPVHSKAFFPLGVLALCLFHTLYEPVGAFLCLPVNVGKVGVEFTACEKIRVCNLTVLLQIVQMPLSI